VRLSPAQLRDVLNKNPPKEPFMISRTATRSLGSLILLAAVSCSASQAAPPAQQPTVAAPAAALATVPEGLAVPAGQNLAFSLAASGVQIYVCQAKDAAEPSWQLQAPRAELFDPGQRSAGTHYAGPTWEALDGSKLVGSKLAAATPDASAIPWLLLQATSHEGAGRMADITYVQRLSTRAGLAPSTGCDAGHAGETVEVAYSATYAFYAAAQ
jgi:Protein of unknown function (DUF3455)